MAGVFEVYEASTSAWKWRLRDETRNVVLTSGGQSWGSKESAKKEAALVANAATGAKIEVS